MIVPGTPEEIRKAAAFVEALAAVERNFGFRLGVGTEAHDNDYFEPVTFGPEDGYALVRSSDDDLPGALALAFVERR